MIVFIASVFCASLKKGFVIRNKKVVIFYQVFFFPIYLNQSSYNNILGLQLDKIVTYLDFRQYSPKGTSFTKSTKDERFLLKVYSEKDTEKVVMKDNKLDGILAAGIYLANGLNLALERRIIEQSSEQFGVAPLADKKSKASMKIVERFIEEVPQNYSKAMKKKKRIQNSDFE